jgi:hypothetical protein
MLGFSRPISVTLKPGETAVLVPLLRKPPEMRIPSKPICASTFLNGADKRIDHTIDIGHSHRCYQNSIS